MEWSRLYASLPDDGRVQAAEDDGRAGWLLIQSFCYCTAAESGGFIPDTQVRRFGGPRLRQRVEALVRERLWVAADGGYVLDPEIWDESRNLGDSVEKKRRADRERIAAKRAAARGVDNRPSSVDNPVDNRAVSRDMSRDSRATSRATCRGTPPEGKTNVKTASLPAGIPPSNKPVDNPATSANEEFIPEMSRDSRALDQIRSDLSLVDPVDHLSRRYAPAREDDDLLKTVIDSVHERTHQVISADRAADIAEEILTGRRPKNPRAYVLIAILREKDPFGRFIATRPPAAVQPPLMAAVPTTQHPYAPDPHGTACQSCGLPAANRHHQESA